MPIAVKDYTWRETEAEVNIVLPLKGVNASRADIVTTERYIKVSYPPYIFEVYLHAAVVEDQCTVKLGNGIIEFRLIKKELGLWGSLICKETAEDKNVLAEKRTEAMEVVKKVAVEETEARAKKKREEERFAIREQMRLEQEERERIEADKQVERDRANQALEKWREENKIKEKQKMDTSRELKKKTQTSSKKTSKPPDIWSEAVRHKLEKKAPLPPPRTGGNIEVKFTPRVFPTAARESRETEEQEWLAKQAAARRITGDNKEDVNERNPEFLKDRGVHFFKTKNYEAAINVFSEAISLNPALPQLFSNRAACYLAASELDLCINDCCTALELYYPVVPSNQVKRAKVFARRGSAYAKSGKLEQAVQDYEAAVELVPGDKGLRDDLSRLNTALEQTPL